MDGYLRAYSVLVFACFMLIVYIVTGHSAIDHKQNCDFFNKHSTNLYRLSLENCTKECAIRSNCHAVNYFRKEHKCALIQKTEDMYFIEEFRSCVHVRKKDMKYRSVCNCSEHETCDQIRMKCEVKECSAISEVRNAIVLGSMNHIGSHQKIDCLPGHVEVKRKETIQCLPNGHWSYQPKCLEVTIGKACNHYTHCGESGYVCIRSICVCDFYHRYNATLMNCVKVCSNMTNEFTEYQGTIISGYNMEISTNLTSCHTDCVKDDMCLAYEMRHHLCHLSLVSYPMAMDAFPEAILNLKKNPKKYSLFSRNCV